jgi:hypothetical protein
MFDSNLDSKTSGLLTKSLIKLSKEKAGNLLEIAGKCFSRDCKVIGSHRAVSLLVNDPKGEQLLPSGWAVHPQS